MLRLARHKPVKAPSEEPASSPSPAPAQFAGFNIFNDTASDDSVDVIQLQADLEAQREDILKIGSAGAQIVSQFEKSMGKVQSDIREVQGEVHDLHEEGKGRRDELVSLRDELNEKRRKCPQASQTARLEEQFQTTDEAVTMLRSVVAKAQSDTDNLRLDLSYRQEELEQVTVRNDKLQQDLASTKKLAKESVAIAKNYARRNEQIQKDLFDTRQIAEEGVATAKEYSSEVTDLRKELKQLRADLAKEKSATEKSERERERLERETPARAPTAATASGLSSAELDILLKRISEIGNRVHQVESKQVDFELFQSRTQKAPIASSSREIGRRQDAIDADSVDLVYDESPIVHMRRPSNQKRKRPPYVESVDDEEELDLPTGRHDPTSDYYSATTTGSSSVGKGQNSSPWTTASTDTTGVRRTKSGAVDKRSLRHSEQHRAFDTKKAANG